MNPCQSAATSGWLIALTLVLLLFGGQPLQAEALRNDVQACAGRSYEIPANVKLVCSATWLFEGTCDSADLWDRWRLTGPPHPNANGEPFVRPWLDHRIIVVGYEMVKIDGGPHAFFMIGSGIHTDAFLWMPPSKDHVRVFFPSGIGHPWPSRAESERQRNAVNDLLDIHGSCATPKPQTKAQSESNTVFAFFKNLLRPDHAVAHATPLTAKIYLTIYYTPWDKSGGSGKGTTETGQ